MKLLTAIFAIAFLLLIILQLYFKRRWLMPYTITAGTFLYHFAMRLAVGYGINTVFKNEMDYTKKWFKQKPFEEKLFKLLKVKKFKRFAPTYSPETFDINKKSTEQIIKATCQAEIVHEIIILLSFLPIIASVWLGDFWVFLITSFLSALFDGWFVILQRYNRPRLIKLLYFKQKPAYKAINK